MIMQFQKDLKLVECGVVVTQVSLEDLSQVRILTFQQKNVFVE